ncbi:MAG: DUF2156 domain-containing protein [Candidatus Hydrogenedentes bacterium]|nr:DUF2156 domain-containing protein [Candidatus Hydrogenedentota bacterium]
MARALDPEEALALVRAYGRFSLSYSILQPGMEYFGEPGLGVIAYRRRMGQCTVLGDPVVSEELRLALIEVFLDRFPNALFMQVHRETGELLRPRGYHLTPVGVENEIQTSAFSLRGKQKADLRHYRNRALAGGVTVHEACDTRALRLELKPVSDSWLPMKSWFHHELEFLARPFVLEPEPDVRIFTARIGARAVGFVVLDPIYESGKVMGYTVTILRHYPDAPEGTVDYINLCVLETLRNDGVALLSLGVSPFHHIDETAREEGPGALPVYLLYRMLRRFGDPIYHFRGLSFHKSRYRAAEAPVYTAVRGRLGLLPVYAASRACRML